MADSCSCSLASSRIHPPPDKPPAGLLRGSTATASRNRAHPTVVSPVGEEGKDGAAAAGEPSDGAPGPGSGGAARSRSGCCSGCGSRSGSRSGCGSGCGSAGPGAGTGGRGPERRAAWGADARSDPGPSRGPPRAGAPRRRRGRRHGLRPRLRLAHRLPLPRISSSLAMPVEPGTDHSLLLRAPRRPFLPKPTSHRHTLRRGLDHRRTDLHCCMRVGRHHHFHQR